MPLDKLYLIDGLNFLFRSYYAIGPMTNPQGESTNALYGFIRSIFKLRHDFSIQNLAVVFDGPDNKKSRTEIYADYKSHRKGMPEDLFPQIAKAEAFCAAAGIPHFSIPGVEADDVIGSIAKWAEAKGAEVFICSGDKDLCQLISDSTFVIQAHKNNLLLDKAKVEELYGVRPDQIVDYLAIVGDASDNIPGLEGFGPKTASTLLQQFGTLDALLETPEKVKGEKKQATLKRDKEIALMSRQLATIDREVPFLPDDALFFLHPPQIELLKAFYQEMHFLSLLKELDPQAGLPQKEISNPHYHLIETLDQLNTLLIRLEKEEAICIDTETTALRPIEAELVGIGFGVAGGEAWYLPMNGFLEKRRLLEILHPFFGKKHLRVYGHNIKYDAHVLLNEGVPLPPICFDTMLASYLVAPHKMRHNLDQLSLERFDAVKTPIEELIGKGKHQISMWEVPLEQVTPYCCADVDYTCRLKKIFSQEMAQAGVVPLFETVEIPLIPILIRMERRGIFLDGSRMGVLKEELEKKIGALEEEIWAAAGESFNLNSPKQLSQILFEKMGIPPPKKTATGFSTNADVLESLQESAPIAKKILSYRSLEKLRSTYAEALPEQISPKTGRIHCTFNQSVAATGRLSCQDPNLQNIPIRSSEGKMIRGAFRPEEEGWSFVSSDYSQIELRILAHLSEDPLLLKAFHAGEDVHAFTAAEVFNVPLGEVTSEMRHKAKAVNFGVLYGQQAFGLSQGLSISFKEAAAFIETYFQRYKKVKEFLEFCKESAKATGRSLTITGRQRPIPEIDSKNPMLRAAAERLAINTPLQGSAADLIKLAMIGVDSLLQKRKELGYMILQIHDELLFESPDRELSTLSLEVKKIMEGVFSMKVPLIVDISFGKNWGEC